MKRSKDGHRTSQRSRFLALVQDDELLRPAVIMGAGAYDVDLSHRLESGKIISKQRTVIIKNAKNLVCSWHRCEKN
jgi:hypothetical protein